MAPISTFDMYGSLFESPSFQQLIETQQRIEKIYSGDIFSRLQGVQQAINGIVNSTSLQALQGLNMSSHFSQLAEIAQQTQRITNQVTPVFAQLQHEGDWLNSIMPNLDFSLRGSIAFSYSALTDAAKRTALSSVLEEFNALDILESPDAEAVHLSDDEKSELENDLAEAVSDQANWEQKLMSAAIKYKSKHPIQAWIFKNIMVALILLILSNMITSWLGTLLKPATVHKAPSADSASTYQLPQAQNVEVIGDAPYYYLIEFEDPDTKEILQGYISKRSVHPVTDFSSPSD